tara:strand:- start:332 stop:457 length:126 start_codon:yes stop_codon:yes gene_type:complete
MEVMELLERHLFKLAVVDKVETTTQTRTAAWVSRALVFLVE